MSEDLNKWLESLGMTQYAQRFIDEDVDFSLLPELTDEDLKSLGLSLGHRRKALKAIREMNQPPEPARTTSERAEVEKAQSPEDRGLGSGEYRPLTVMFADMVGSTDLTNRLDPEDMRELTFGFQSNCTAIVNRIGGLVVRYMGDGVLAYFGYPKASENDAERAVLCGLDLIKSMAKLNQNYGDRLGVDVAVRVGIATGEVVIDEIGEGQSREHAAVGVAANLAARLQGQADRNCLIVSTVTRDIVADAFDFERVGEQMLKGFDQPYPIWRVAGRRRGVSRFEVNKNERVLEFVNRFDEVAILESRWNRALTGEAQVLHLNGEPGIGKSRLIREFIRRVDQQTDTRINLYCSAYHTRSALYPLIERVEHEAGFLSTDDDDIKLTRLRDVLCNQYGFDNDGLQAFASLLQLHQRDEYETIVPAASDQLDVIEQQYCAYIDALSAKQMVLISIEDSHWIDPTTDRLVRRLIQLGNQGQRFILIASRPESAEQYNSPEVQRLSLNRLSRQHSNAIIGAILSHTRSTPALVEQINQKCMGVPLYLEEFTRMTLDNIGTSLADEGHQDFQGSLNRVPESLKASMRGWLDKLEYAREVTQVAAVFGDLFEIDSMVAVSGESKPYVEQVLTDLVEQNVLKAVATGRHTRYCFRHDLLKNAAYESLLKTQRRGIHRRIADYLESRFTAREEVLPEMIAYHFTEADSSEQAFQYWLLAGQRALGTGATREAAEMLDSAFRCYQSMADSALPLETLYAFFMARGKSHNATFGASSAIARDSFAKAVEAARAMDDIDRLVDALDNEFGIIFNAGKLRESLVPADTMRKIGLERNHAGALISGYQGLGMAYFVLGESAKAMENLLAGLKYREQKDTGVNCYPSMSLSYLSWCQFLIGDADGARESAKKAIQTGQEESAYAGATALSNSCVTFVLLNDPAVTRTLAEQLIDLADEAGLRMYHTRGLMFESWASASEGNSDSALVEFKSTVDSLIDSGEEIEATFLLGVSAEQELRFGRLADAEVTLERARALADKNEERFYLAELFRLMAELVHKTDVPVEGIDAQTWIEMARGVAMEQGANGWDHKLKNTRT